MHCQARKIILLFLFLFVTWACSNFFCPCNIYLRCLNKTEFHFDCFVGWTKFPYKLNTELERFSKLSYTSCCNTLKYLFVSSFQNKVTTVLYFLGFLIFSLLVFFFKKNNDCCKRFISLLFLFKGNASKWVR